MALTLPCITRQRIMIFFSHKVHYHADATERLLLLDLSNILRTRLDIGRSGGIKWYRCLRCYPSFMLKVDRSLVITTVHAQKKKPPSDRTLLIHSNHIVSRKILRKPTATRTWNLPIYLLELLRQKAKCVFIMRKNQEFCYPIPPQLIRVFNVATLA